MKPATPIIIDCIPEKEYLSPEFQLSVSSKSEGLFIYETSDPAVFIVNQDGIVTITGPGRAYVIIKQLESENFAPNQIDRLIVVNKSKPPITFSGPTTLLLTNTPLSARILKIETITELIRNVFSIDESILKINQIIPGEYELIPVSMGKASIIVSTRSNYYFNSTSARFDIEVLETLKDQPLVLNINTFGPQFKHNALKDIDILTSNNILEPKSNNLQIAVQQQTRGYNYDIPVLNLTADKFINSINNYNKEILCCSIDKYLTFSVQWNFGNNIVYDFFPYEGNINDRPRINLFRSDGKYIDYASGGFNFLKIPKNSGPDDPNAYIYQKWGNRNIGIKQFKVPDIECLVGSSQTFIPFDPSARANFWDFTQDPNNKTLSDFRIIYTNGSITADWGDGSQSGINSNINYSHTFRTTGSQLPSLYYGIDFFTTEDLRPTVLNPPSGQWTITNTAPNELKYQYLFTGNYEKNIVIQLPLFTTPNAGPAGLTASNITVNSMTISWAATPGATSYRLDVSTVSNFATRLTGYDDLIVNGTSQQITGLTAGTIYYVRVRAVNAAGTSPNSATLTQITVPVAPNQPVISNVTSATFTASWNSVAGASSYRVDVATSSDFTSGFITGYNNRTVGSTSVTVIGLSPGTTYYIRVRAFNDQTANPVTSANSPNAEQLTLIAAPNAPTATNITTTSFTANWNSVADASSYRLDVSTVSNFATRLPAYDNLVVNGTSQSITGLTAGTIYYVRVRAVNLAGTSLNSPTLTQITVPAAPNQPTISDINIDKFTVNWDAVTGATSYQIDVATNSDFTSLISPSSIIPIPSYLQAEVILTPYGVSIFNTYYIRIRAVNSAGISANSEIKTIKLGAFQEEGSILAFASSLIENETPPGEPPLPENMFFSNLRPTFEQVQFDPLLSPIPSIYSAISSLCNCFTPPLLRDLRFGSGVKYQTITDGFNIYTSSSSGLLWKNSYPSKVITAVDMSRDGQYQVGVGSGVHFSTDFGENWISKNINLQLSDIAISDSGLYQIAVGLSGSDTPLTPTSFNFYRSINSGNTWTKSINGISGFRAVAMSSNGQYQITYNSSGIYTSDNYGSSWELKLQNSFIQDLDISTNGQYQTFITFKEIFNSNDYGNTWTQVSNLNIQIAPFAQYNPSYFDINSFAFNKIRISRKNPQYQAVNMIHGKIIRSVDFGNSWNPLFFNTIGPLIQNPPLDFRISANWSLLGVC